MPGRRPPTAEKGRKRPQKAQLAPTQPAVGTVGILPKTTYDGQHAPLQLPTPLVCLAGALLLPIWCVCRQQPPFAPGVRVISVRPDTPIDMTAWIPQRKEFVLRNFPPDRPKSSDDPTDDGYVRPAWGILYGMILLGVYIFGQGGAIHFPFLLLLR